MSVGSGMARERKRRSVVRAGRPAVKHPGCQPRLQVWATWMWTLQRVRNENCVTERSACRTVAILRSAKATSSAMISVDRVRFTVAGAGSGLADTLTTGAVHPREQSIAVCFLDRL